MLCNACGERVPLAGPHSITVLLYAGNQYLVFERGLALDEGEVFEGASSREDVRLSIERRPLSCLSCGTPLTIESLAPSMSGSSSACPACRTELVITPCPDALARLDPRVRYVLHGPLPPADTEQAITMTCGTCGASLVLDRGSRTISCRYCGSSNHVPDTLWKRLHPTKAHPWLFLILEFEPIEIWVARYRIDFGWALRDAQDPSTPAERRAILAQSAYPQVRSSLAPIAGEAWRSGGLNGNGLAASGATTLRARRVMGCVLLVGILVGVAVLAFCIRVG